MSKDISAYLFLPFIKSAPPYLSLIKQYNGIQKIAVYNEKWCNLPFSVWCWS